MRLWSVHPKYLDPAGLVALWREALLAQAVLRGRTLGYRRHPQLQRFRECPSPRSAINSYLAGLYAESIARGYRFDGTKPGRVTGSPRIVVTRGQLDYEWNWLLHKLRVRDIPAYKMHRVIVLPDAHPLFSVVPGPVSAWERVHDQPAT